MARTRRSSSGGNEGFDREQLSAFLGSTLTMAPKLYPLFFTMARTGVRIGEALAMQWPDFDFKGREIRIERAITNDGVVGTPKSGHGRTVDMSTSLREVLQRHQAKLSAAWLKKKPEKDENGDEKPKREMPPWAFPSDAWTPRITRTWGRRSSAS
jgi:integrase